MSCWFFLGTLLGLLLFIWKVLCLFGIVLGGLLVGSPLGAFLLMVTLLTWLLGERVMNWVVLLQFSLDLKVVLEVTGLVRLVEAQKSPT